MRARQLVMVVALGAACLAACLASACNGSFGPTFSPDLGSADTTPGTEPAAPVGPSVNATPNPLAETPEEPDTPDPPDTPSAPAPADNNTRGWYYIANTSHSVPSVASGAASLLASYNGRYIGQDPDLVYLTFDEGYENGYTATILDALKRNGVKATFLVTESYIRKNPDLVRRMVAEGHVVGSHSATHPSMPSLATDPEAFAAEFTRTEDAFREVTGREMPHIFRPPMGEYSPLSLWQTRSLGYETVFWSFAHRDWLVDDQPAVDVTVQRILDGSHPGAIYLLHAVSSSNTAALDDAIAGLRAQGYGFGTLDD